MLVSPLKEGAVRVEPPFAIAGSVPTERRTPAAFPGDRVLTPTKKRALRSWSERTISHVFVVRDTSWGSPSSRSACLMSLKLVEMPASCARFVVRRETNAPRARLCDMRVLWEGHPRPAFRMVGVSPLQMDPRSRSSHRPWALTFPCPRSFAKVIEASELHYS